MTIPLPERFWPKVDRSGDCWLWTASKNGKGYGQFTHPEFSTQGAHRVAWILTNGPILNNLCVCHHCDNPSCCNPAHLFLGTKADNIADAKAKGRIVKGERRHNAKLTEYQVRVILGTPQYLGSGLELAKRFGVSPGIICRIRHRRAWKHIQPQKAA